jgi:hypothetical protein
MRSLALGPGAPLPWRRSAGKKAELGQSSRAARETRELQMVLAKHAPANRYCRLGGSRYPAGEETT